MSTYEAVIERSKCPKCGADVRPDSLFCYNCGGRVTDDGPIAAGNDNQIDRKEMIPAPGLRTARDLKRRERTFRRPPKEVIWEPATVEPVGPVVTITVIVLLFTIAVIVLTLYMR